MDVYMRDTLKTLEARLNAFLSSLTASPTAANAPAAALDLLDADDALTRALDTLRAHQQNYARLLLLNREARALEGKVKDTVRDVLRLSEEIGEARCDGVDEGGSDEEDEDGEERVDEDESKRETGAGDGDGDGDVCMTGTPDIPPPPQNNNNNNLKPRKEINYSLLLAFARRISKFPTSSNLSSIPPDAISLSKQQSPIPSPPSSPSPSRRSPTPPLPGHPSLLQPPYYLTPQSHFAINAVADHMRATSHIPFPTEDRIRMGLMGRLQGAAAENGPDPDVAVEEIMAEKEREMREKWEEEKRRNEKEESVGLMEHDMQSPSQAYIMREPGEGLEFGLDGVGGGVRPQPQPKGFDLDLFDPDEEDEFEE